MDAATQLPATEAYSPPRHPWRTFFKVSGILLLAFVGSALAALLYLNYQFMGSKGGSPRETIQTLIDPRSQFPGQERITVLCLGLDRNVFTNHRDKKDPRNGVFFTKGARSDVMMIASLDLASQKVNILSVPRDTRVILPGRRVYSKINDAHARGGIPYTRDTVEEFLATKLDYHVVIKQEAIMKVVDALGGLDVNVDGALVDGQRTDMDYDDNWGQLHIHLKPGRQHLNGYQVVGYMRFRHDAEGDLGRIRRQQQVIQLLSQKVKSPSVVTRAPRLIDAIHEFVATDLTPQQQFALSVLFHKINPANVQTASLPVADTPTIDGISYVVADDQRKEAMVDWLINGNEEAMNRLIRVELKNASGDPELYQRVYRYLRHSGFEVWRAGRASGTLPASRVVQRTTLKGSGRRLLDTLGLSGSVEKGEGSAPDVTFYVGKDLERNSMMAFADNWADLPDYAPPPRRREPERRRARVERTSPVPVQVRTIDPEQTPADPGEQDQAAPPEPAPASEGPSKPAPAPPPSDSPAPPPAPGQDSAPAPQ